MDRFRALLLSALGVLGLVLLTPLPASATPAPSVSQPIGIQPAQHTCQRFGAIVKDNVAAQCADVETFANSKGMLGVRGAGQAFCLRDSTSTYAKCAGIVQSVIITNLTTPEHSPVPGNVMCGSFGGPACPAAGRYSTRSSGILVFCDNSYQTTVRTTTVLPSSLGTSRSVDWKSGEWKFTDCN